LGQLSIITGKYLSHRGEGGAFRGRFFTGPLEKRSGSVGTRAVAGMWSKKDTGYLYKALVVVLRATAPPRFPGDPTKIPPPESDAPAPRRLAMTIQNNLPLKAVAGATVSFLPLLSCVFLPGGKFLSDGRRISTSAALLIPRRSFIFMTLLMALS
jgi:hypothetical protein